MPESFGALLRAARTAAGVSMGELARRTTYHKSYLSKVENDHKPANETIARLCDAALDTGGTLSAALATVAPAPPLPEPSPPPNLLVAATPPAPDEAVLAALRTVFDGYRSLGMVSSPRLVLGAVTVHAEVLRPLAVLSPEAAAIAARVAEYAGWMSQEAGDDATALWWTNQAVTLGATPDLRAHALIRRAEIALYRHDPLSTVALARDAQADPAASPRTLGLAARCEAQGHALSGDASACAEALERAETLLSRDSPEWSPLGSTIPQVALARGWTLLDLGHARESAALLDAHIGVIPGEARRARARFTVRQALAHAQAGEVDHACALTTKGLPDITAVDSATIRTDLKILARTLARWRTHGPVRDLAPRLNQALALTG